MRFGKTQEPQTASKGHPGSVKKPPFHRVLRPYLAGRLNRRQEKAPPKRGFAWPGNRRDFYSLLAADWRAMKLSKVFSATRNHSTSSLRKGFHESKTFLNLGFFAEVSA